MIVGQTHVEKPIGDILICAIKSLKLNDWGKHKISPKWRPRFTNIGYCSCGKVESAYTMKFQKYPLVGNEHIPPWLKKKNILKSTFGMGYLSSLECNHFKRNIKRLEQNKQTTHTQLI